ncbi:uncharacterized protein LOC121374615 [Gigantopelta aegis]|uniref:uncharacterized protein LOC121374615 n=1 Tax=Gigantopelta aegis TaxID=1735272 RepID=UPI001B8886D2|nr:uncharacterized protein LOC121374615 [Gigantopelta aegis]
MKFALAICSIVLLAHIAATITKKTTTAKPKKAEAYGYDSRGQGSNYGRRNGYNMHKTNNGNYGQGDNGYNNGRSSGYNNNGGGYPSHDGGSGYNNNGGGSGYNNNGGGGGYNNNGGGGGYKKTSNHRNYGYRICPNQTFYDDVYRWSDIGNGYPIATITTELGMRAQLLACLMLRMPRPRNPTVPAVDPMLGLTKKACNSTSMTLRSYFSANPMNLGRCWAITSQNNANGMPMVLQAPISFVKCQYDIATLALCCTVLLAHTAAAITSNETTTTVPSQPKKSAHFGFMFGNRGGIPVVGGYSRGGNVGYNRPGRRSNSNHVGYSGTRSSYPRNSGRGSGYNSYGGNRGTSKNGGGSVYPTHGRGGGYPSQRGDRYGGRQGGDRYGGGSGYPSQGGNRYGGNSGYGGGSGYSGNGGGHSGNGYGNSGGQGYNTYPTFGKRGYLMCPNQTFFDNIYRWSDLATGYPLAQINVEIAAIAALRMCLARTRPAVTAPTVPATDPMLGTVRSACTKTQMTLRSYFSVNPANRGQCWALARQGLMTYVKCQNEFCNKCKAHNYYGEFESRCITTYSRVSLWAYCENRAVNNRIVFDTILLPTCCECGSIKCYRNQH